MIKSSTYNVSPWKRLRILSLTILSSAVMTNADSWGGAAGTITSLNTTKIGINGVVPLQRLSLGVPTGTTEYIFGQFAGTGVSTNLSGLRIGGAGNTSATPTDWAGMEVKQSWTTSTQNQIYFYTASGTSSSAKMTILGNGNVGIGNTNPSAALAVNNSGMTGSTGQVGLSVTPTFGTWTAANPYARAGYFQLKVNNATFATTNGAGLFIDVPSVTGTVTNRYGLQIADQTGGTTNYSIYTGLGQVRFGDKVTASGALDVNGISTFNANLNISAERINFGTTSNNAVINSNFSTRMNIDADNNATVESFIIGNNQSAIDQNNVLLKVQEDGRVGIGIANPAGKLHVQGDNVEARISDSRDAVGGSAALGLQSGGQLARLKFYYNDRFAIDEAGTIEYLTIKRNGNVGIGNINPVAKLDVVGSASFTGKVAVGPVGLASDVGMYVGGAMSGFSGTSNVGLISDFTFPATATSMVQGIRTYVRTSAAAYTVADAIGINVTNPIKGAGSAITNSYGLKIEDITSGSTNNYALYTGAGKVRFGGPVEFTGGLGHTTISGQLTVNHTSDQFLIKNPLGAEWRFGTNIGASGANKNFTIFEAGAGSNYLTILQNSGNVGLGTVNPTAKLDIKANNLSGVFQAASSNMLTGNNVGLTGADWFVGTYTVGNSPALPITVANTVGLYVGSNAKGAGSTITNQYGIYMENIDKGLNNYAIKTQVGKVHFGDAVDIFGPTKIISTGNALARIDGNQGILELNSTASTGKLWSIASKTDGALTVDYNNLTSPFKIESGAPNSSLHVKSNGDVNISGNLNVSGSLNSYFKKISVGAIYNGVDIAAVVHGDAGLTGANQYGLWVSPVFGNQATNIGTGGTFGVTLANSAFGQATTRGLHVLNPNKLGGTASINTNIGIEVADQTAGSYTNYAIKTGLGRVYFGGTVEMAGGQNVTGDFVYNNALTMIRSGTDLGADSKSIALTGSGSVAATRGAFVRAYGNNHATDPGNLELTAGMGSGRLKFHVGGAWRYELDNFGTHNFLSPVKVSTTLTLGAGIQMENAQQIMMKNASGTTRYVLGLQSNNNLEIGGTVDGGLTFLYNLGNTAGSYNTSGSWTLGPAGSTANNLTVNGSGTFKGARTHFLNTGNSDINIGTAAAGDDRMIFGWDANAHRGYWEGVGTSGYPLSIQANNGRVLIGGYADDGVSNLQVNGSETVTGGLNVKGATSHTGRVEFGDMYTSFQSGDYGMIYGTNNSGTYPFNGSGNLVISARTTAARDIVFQGTWFDNTVVAGKVEGGTAKLDWNYPGVFKSYGNGSTPWENTLELHGTGRPTIKFSTGNAGLTSYIGGGIDGNLHFAVGGDGEPGDLKIPLRIYKDEHAEFSKDVVVGGTLTADVIRTNKWGIPPDYVFEKNYKLASLENVEKFLDKNKHLPEIPSAKEIEKDGINLAEMNMKLLKKVEELTLYAISQNKEIGDLKSRLSHVETVQRKGRSPAKSNGHE